MATVTQQTGLPNQFGCLPLVADLVIPAAGVIGLALLLGRPMGLTLTTALATPLPPLGLRPWLVV